jgi:signal transduction histidine kinase/CheY-like chemotaxis protein
LKGKLLNTVFLSCFLFLAYGQPEAEKGILDLRGFNFTEQETLPLTGEWEFYWNKLYSSQSLEAKEHELKPDYIDYLTRWGDLPEMKDKTHQFGFATLRLKLFVDEEIPSLSLYLPEVYSAFDLYVNNEGFEGNGVVGTSRENSKPYWRPASKVVNLKPGLNTLVVHMSNFRHHKGGAVNPIVLGTSDSINYSRNFKISSILFLAGCLLIAGGLAFGFYWFNPADYTGLFLFLFCCSYSYRVLGTEEYVIHAVNRNIPWTVTLRLEYISLYLSVVFYTYFIRNLIEPKVKLIAFHILAGISVILALLSLVLPTETFTSFIDLYLAFLGITMLVVGLSYVRKINLKHKTSWVTLIGGLMLGVVAGQKILTHFNIWKENELISTLGYVGFIFSQSIAMTIRFGRGFRERNLAARAAARSKDQFLNTMSHELRTPMSAILGMADLLQLSKLTPEQKEKIDTIKNSGESLLSIIKDILSITEADNNSVVLDHKALSIKECMNGSYELASLNQKNEVKYVSYIDPAIPQEIMGDAVRLKQIMVHLLNNAFKFTSKGQVEFKAHLKEKKEKHLCISFEVKDTGIGMNRSTMGKVFSAFSQEDSGNSRRYGGLGIGLTIVKQIVEKMGGRIELDSELGVGTKVAFHVNLAIEAGQSKKEESTLKEIDKGLRVLYAEDNPVNQKLMQMILKTMGIEADMAENGREAWEMAKENNYHLILMDIQMPEMDGIESTKKIIQDLKVRPIIIAVTANATISDKKRCFEAGMNDFLTKPVKADVLKEGIKKWQNLMENIDESKPSGKYIQLSS